jgi:glyoxylase-like metal-dependent hydrolase (beta-lactamase superfamily II)
MEKYGLHQVTIPLPFRLNHVHCYLAQNGEGWTIVDTGLNREETRRAWEEAFSSCGIHPEKSIHSIILTHYHPDHFGYAGAMQEWTGANIHMNEAAKKIALDAWTEATFARNKRFVRAAGVPEDIAASLEENDQVFYSLVRPFPERIGALREGEHYRIGELMYEAIHTPGHAEGHICFYNKEEKILIAGDHVLKKITPNISYHGYGDENPLKTYLESLKKVHSLDVALVLPGHGPVFTDFHERVAEIICHHEERLGFILEHIKGHMTAFQISCSLFNRELSVHEQRFAMGETIAHLNYLLSEGGIQKEEDKKGILHYSII